MFIEIAGISVHIPMVGAEALSIYKNFQINSHPDLTDITIEQDEGRFPMIQQAEEVYIHGTIWRIFRDKNGNYIFFDSTLKDHIQGVKITHHFTQALVFCKKISSPNKEMQNAFMVYPLVKMMLTHHLAMRSGGLVHASAVCLNGSGYIFAGESGVGKSTLIKLFLQQNVGIPIAEEKVAVRKINDSFRVYGTPWTGEVGIAENTHAPLKSVFFIGHGDSNRIITLTSKTAFMKLLAVISIPWYDKHIVSNMLDFCENLVITVPCYEVQFKPDPEIVHMIEKFANG